MSVKSASRRGAAGLKFPETAFWEIVPLARRVNWAGNARRVEPAWRAPTRSRYRILATSPGLIEPSAEIAAGTSDAKSRRRFVGPQRITKEIFRPARLC